MHASAAEQHRCERDEEGNKITIRSTEWPDFLDGLLQVEQKFTAGDGGALIYRYKEQSQATKDYHQAFCAELGMVTALGELSVDPVTACDQPVGRFNRYRYANGNPYKFKDPDGRTVETVWDVANIAMGATSAYSNFSHGNVGAGIVDSIGVAIDATAAAVPFVPGGAGTAIKAARGLEKAVDGARTADKLGDAGKMVGDLPKPPTGPGSVPVAQRDPQRLLTDSARESKRAEQGGKSATGCETSIDRSNSAGHHVERHADGGPTTSSNHAEVCLDCHKQLHGRD